MSRRNVAICSEDASGHVVVTNYDLLGRAVSTSLDTPDGPRLTSTTYNELGWVLAATDAEGATTTYEYDRAGRVLKTTVTEPGAAAATTTHEYDVSGNETMRTDADGWVTETVYDDFGRALRRFEYKTTAPGVLVHDVHSSWDAADRVTETSDTVTGSRTTFRYAASLADVTEVVRRLEETTLTIELAPSGLELRRVFESSEGAVESTLGVAVTIRRGTTKPELWEYESGASTDIRLSARDEAGRIGIQMAMGSARYYFDPSSGRKYNETVSGRVTDYTYTDEGRLATAKSGTDATLTYSYDDAGAITQAGATTLVYDTVGGTLASSVTNGCETTYDYDARGRRTYKLWYTQAHTLAGVATYTWSDGDRLTGLTTQDFYEGTDVSASFTYDASGQRTRSVVTSGGVTTTTTYTYEGLELTRLRSASAGVTTTIDYIFDEEGKPQALSVSMTDTSAVYTLPIWTTDRGDVGYVADLDRNDIASWTYDPYGRPLTATVASAPGVPLSVAQRIAALQPLRYAGYAYDAFSGLYYCSQRYYDPATAQFISRDPVLSDAEESAYQYCGGDPVGKVDPSGLRFWSTTSVVGKGVGQGPAIPPLLHVDIRSSQENLAPSDRSSCDDNAGLSLGRPSMIDQG